MFFTFRVYIDITFFITYCSFRAEKVTKEWTRAVESHPDKPKLWRKFIEFSMSNFAKFTVSNLRSVLTRAITVLNSQKRVYGLGHEKHRFLEYRALVVAVTACYVERQVGHNSCYRCFLTHFVGRIQ